MVRKLKRWQLDPAWRAWERREAPEKQRPQGPWIKRWIGAARRRENRNREEETPVRGNVITLTWAQTFGRPPASSAAVASPTDTPSDHAVAFRKRR